MSTKNTLFDVVVIGGGLSGLTLSCILGRADLRVACIDQAPPLDQQKTDLRTTAVSFGSMKVIERAGAWALMEGKTSPINNIEIYDGNSPMLLNFLHEEVEGKSFGWIVENMELKAALVQVMQGLDHVSYFPSSQLRDFSVAPDQVRCHFTQDGADKEIAGRLVIGADGRGSFTRKWMGIHTRQWSYHQRAVICNVEHENPHDNIAIEHFWPAGPFAILPMADDAQGRHRSSVVFTEHGPEKDTLMNYGVEAFNTALAARFPAFYGEVKLLGERAVYPLGLIHASSYIGPRMALVADAAHGIHPIAGQGLNLGFRDVDEISHLIIQAHKAGDDIGAQPLLETYQRRRRPDNVAMIAVTDGLTRLFSNNIPPVRLLRRAGLKLVSKIRPAKRFFMKQAMGDR